MGTRINTQHMTSRSGRPGLVRERIGFYGCAREGDGRLVRVGEHETRKSHTHAAVDCPVCGEFHRVVIMWRYRMEEDGKVEVML